MFLGPPLPLSPDLPLTELLACARPPGPLGAWVRPCVGTLRVYQLSPLARRWVLASPDLGFLLTRCNHVVVREGQRPVVLEAETVIHWRALQVATATPYLPGLARLQALFPGLHAATSGFLIPVRKESPEEVLALCVEEGMRVTGSRIVYSMLPDSDSPQPSRPLSATHPPASPAGSRFRALHCAPVNRITS